MARVVVITGPSGVGKGTLIRALRDRIPELELSVSATTRAPRPGEEHGRDYWFFSREEFDRKIDAGDFVEWAEYSGNRYGTLRQDLDLRVANDRPVLLEIEVQGARQVAESMPEALRIFIAPPSPETLRTRLVGRGTDAKEQIDRRLAVAEEELAAQPEFPVVVVNDRLEDAIAELTRVVREGIDEARQAAPTPAG
jgi:guanylate kinase